MRLSYLILFDKAERYYLYMNKVKVYQKTK